MKKIILALALCCMAIPAYADKPAPPPVKHHHKHKVTVVTPPPVLPPPVVVVVPPPPVVPPVVVDPPVPVVVPPVVQLPHKLCGLKPTCPDYESHNFIPSAHIAVGVGAQAPWASGLLGLRMEFPKVFLGLEPFVSVPYGVGADALIYAYRGPVVQFYPLSVGFMINWNYGQKTGAFGTNAKFLSDQDINRLWDLRLGAGVQIKVACHVSLTADWRVSIPDPIKLVREDNICMNCGNGSARKLDGNTAVGNAFAQSQLLVGVLIR